MVPDLIRGPERRTLSGPFRWRRAGHDDPDRAVLIQDHRIQIGDHVVLGADRD
jgi:hypothetical protein